MRNKSSKFLLNAIISCAYLLMLSIPVNSFGATAFLLQHIDQSRAHSFSGTSQALGVNTIQDSIPLKKPPTAVAQEYSPQWISTDQAKDKTILTVAMHHNMPPLTFTDRNGRPVGLFVDLWRLWSEKTGKKIEFLPSSWGDSLTNLKTGKADIHAGLYFSDQRSSWMIFSQSFYESDASVFFPSNQTPITSFDQLDGKNVGVVAKTFHETYLKKNYPGLIIVPFRTTQEMVDAIENNKIRAFFAVPYLTSRILMTMGLTGSYDRMDERHGREKFRAGLLKGNENLLKLVDHGLGQISNEELGHIEERWIPNPKERVFDRQKKEIRLTTLEEDLVKEYPVWRLAVTVRQKPYVVNTSDTFGIKHDRASGIVFDYLKILSERLDVIINPVVIPQPEIRDLLNKKQFDLFMGMEMPEDYPDIYFSDGIFTVSYVIVTRIEEPYTESLSKLNGKRVAAVQNTVVFNHIQSAFPNIHLVFAENELDALHLTSTGTVTATICDVNIAGNLIAANQLINLKIAAPFQAPEISLRFGMDKVQPFVALLNKAIHSITPQEHEQINRKWNPVQYNKGADWKIVKQWVFGISTVFIIILSIILFWARRLSLEVVERMKAESALKESQERYRGIFDFTQNGIAVYRAVDAGRDFVFEEFNRSAEQIERLSRKAVIGKYVSEIFPGYKDIRLLDLFQRVHQTGEPEALPVSLYKDDRISGWREYFVYKLPSDEIVAVFSDQTERKENETEKAKLRSQLNQSQKMESIGTLAGGIAHDFNNILGIIMGYIDLTIEDNTKPEEILNRMVKAQQACIRAKDVVYQLLRFSRRTEEKKEPVHLATLIRDSLKLIRSLLPATIDVQVEITTHSDMVLADATQLHQVLLNLCTNAAHAMETTVGVLTIRLSELYLDEDAALQFHDLPSGNYLQLAVSDTGVGVEAEIKERIFDPYFTTKEVGKGTGMGLAIVAGVVRNHNGFISVDSEPGRGTTFKILLPACTGMREMVSIPVQQNPGGTERILLVDDEPMIVQLEKEILEKYGYSVTARQDSIEALTLFQQDPNAFDLVLTDMTMPKMTGDQLISAILAIRPDIPIILCTGFSETMNSEQAFRIGAKHYIEKPLGKDQLTQTVRQVLDQPLNV